MSRAFPKLYLAKHVETAWSISGQHTGRADIPLTDQGERNARSLGARLKGLSFVKVLTSPLQRAKRTSELAGFGTVAIIDPDLVEWNYGQYEGKRTVYPEKLVLDVYKLADFSKGSQNRANWLPALDGLRTFTVQLPRPLATRLRT